MTCEGSWGYWVVVMNPCNVAWWVYDLYLKKMLNSSWKFKFFFATLRISLLSWGAFVRKHLHSHTLTNQTPKTLLVVNTKLVIQDEKESLLDIPT